MTDLSELYVDALEFERSWWKFRGARETAIRERFDMSEWRFEQIVNHVIDLPAAMAYDAQLVRRLHRLRDIRRRARTDKPTR